MKCVAAFRDGPFSPNVAISQFRVDPLWWETWWARLLALALGAGAIALFLWSRLRAAARRHEEILAKQKLESLGVLTAGIAHDFNNFLGSILAQAELAAAEVATGSVPREEIHAIQRVAVRAAEVVRELMIYAGQDTGTLAEVDVSLLVEEMLQLLKVSISKHATLKTELAKNLPAVLGNATQIRQVVMNLILNASEAIGEKTGLITVTTARLANPASPDFIRLEVSDTGQGMTEEAKRKIFDPFFTTKFGGRGLGLSVVQGIVRAHGGTVHLTSAPGKGTTFEILLPSTVKPAKQEQGDSPPASRIQTKSAVGTVPSGRRRRNASRLPSKDARQEGLFRHSGREWFSGDRADCRSRKNRSDPARHDHTWGFEPGSDRGSRAGSTQCKDYSHQCLQPGKGNSGTSRAADPRVYSQTVSIRRSGPAAFRGSFVLGERRPTSSCSCLKTGGKMVGAQRFELWTSWSRTRRSTRLSHAPKDFSL